MRGLILALQFLTRLPTPQVANFRSDDLARCAAWFPAVGLIIGTLLAGLFALYGVLPAAFVALLILKRPRCSETA